MSLLHLIAGMLTSTGSVISGYRVVVSGDSTSADFAGGTAIATMWFSPEEIEQGYVADSIAVPGATVANQKATWLVYPDKLLADVVTVQVGLNNIPTASGLDASETITAIQDYVDTIRGGIKVGAKIVISQMTPANERWPDIDGDPTGCRARYAAVNLAIADGTITGVDGVVTEHVGLMGDVDFNLLPEYDTGDHIHPNDAGRIINKNALRAVVDPLFA